MDSSVDPKSVIEKLVVKIANAELANVMLQVALESAQRELADLRGNIDRQD